MYTKKNEIYVISQPKKLILSILVVDLPLTEPLSDKIHNNLGWLVNYSDIFFVFSEPHLKDQKMVDKIKFTSLYQGCGFIDSKTKSLGSEIIKILQYDKEIFEETKNHLGLTIGKLSDLESYKEPDFLHIRDVVLPNITRPIYTERRLTSKELFNIYELKNNTTEVFYDRDKGKIFSTILNALKKRSQETDKIGMYCTWHSDSPFIYIPKISLNTILQYKKSDELGFKDWIDTFITLDPRYLFASLINYVGLEKLNMEIGQVKL